MLKVDRQDDPSALRVFSSAVVVLLIDIMGEQKSAPSSAVLSKDLSGLVVYLFVFGELVDAFQNRFLKNVDCVKMVLHAHYFLEIWRSSLSVLGYKEKLHFISLEAYNILGYLVHGFMSLVFVYRNCLDNDNYPLCPWLHSTKSCEHTFGKARKNKPDFTFADFLLMQPKLRVLFDAAVQTGEYEGGANARAAGYFHTQYSAKGIDIPALASFPTDHTIHDTAILALHEAESLFSLCGIPVSDALYHPPHSTSVNLPSIDQWLLAEPVNDKDQDQDIACSLADKPPVSVAIELNELLHTEGRPLASAAFDDMMDVYALSGVALELEEQNAM